MSSTSTLQVNTIALIVGVSVTATVLVVLLVIGIFFWCRKISRKRKKSKSRTQLYVVSENAASPYSSVNGPSPGGLHSFNVTPGLWGSSFFLANGYDNNGLDIGEFRVDPLADGPRYMQPMSHGASVVDAQHRKYNNDVRQYGVVSQLSQSTQSISDESQALYHSFYSKLVDTIHTHSGRPLYLCKRQDYRGMLADHFDIIGKSRLGDWLVKPKSNVPNRPKRPSKKPKAPKSSNSQNSKTGSYNDRENAFIARPVGGGGGSSGMIATPFGAAERMPRYYFGGSNLSRSNSNVEPHYSSLPRTDVHGSPYKDKKMVKRQTSMGAVDRQQKFDEKTYAKVMQKNALNGDVQQIRENPNRRPISVIEESPKLKVKGGVANSKNEKPNEQHRERSGSASTMKSLGAGITDQFKFLEQYDTEEERF